MEFPDDTTVAERLKAMLAEVSGLQTQFDVFRFLKRLTEARGLRAFIVLSLPNEFARDLSTHTLLTNWPTELLSAYDEQVQLPASPAFRKLRSTTRPFHLNIQSDKGIPADYARLLSRFGMNHCLWFPVHNAAGDMGAIAFSSEEPPAPGDLFELAILSVAVYDQLHRIDRRDPAPREVLTERETACLTWTSAGKTSAEIAEILALSEHTINHYLNRATRKLDAVNRTQAVANALRRNIIK